MGALNWDALRGQSASGAYCVQSKPLEGYMVLRRRDWYGGWERVCETRYYADACAALDACVQQNGDIPSEAT